MAMDKTYYARGLAELKKRLPEHALADFQVYESRLLEVIDRERFGSTETTRSGRAMVIADLNDLATKYITISFTDLCAQIAEWLDAQYAIKRKNPDHVIDIANFRLKGIEPLVVITPSPGPPFKPPTESDLFVDLEIRILGPQASGYPVDIVLDDPRTNQRQQFDRGYLPTDIESWVPTGNLVEDGRRLYDTFVGDPKLLKAWAQALGQAPKRRIRLQIDEAAPRLHALPWELLHDGNTFLSADAKTPFSRFLPVAAHWGGSTGRPIRVLAVISNPKDLHAQYSLSEVDVELEQWNLQNALSRLGADKIQWTFLPEPVTLELLEKELRNGYHILHYVGHGTFGEKNKKAILYLQGEDGNTEPASDEELRSRLVNLDAPPQLVFLAACESAKRSTTDAFLGLGPKLVRAGVPAVVAMQADVAMKTARKLSEVFYERLIAHGVVDRAMNEARSTLLAVDRPDAAVPVLFMRLEDGRLWEP